ncbi:hypothetical protein GALL_122490 [mine drainage metagenome]|uniref:Lipoprotein n=1 Tax=mine drainage metagenome TaxID=410659 RepID=A0A1J5SBB4_9ZZZZ
MNINRLFIILALLCCSGCSMVTLGYNQADWILRYWINDYTSFNTSQKEQIHLEVDNYLRWHRKNALPGYIAFLQDLDAAVNQKTGMTVADVMRLRTESGRLYQLTMEPMIRPAAHILSTLDSDQITELAYTLAERNRKQREKMLEGNEQEMLNARAERHVDLVESMVGSLSSAQEKAITAMSLHIPFASRAFIEQRETRQAGLIALLRDKAGEDKIAALLRQWLISPESLRTPQQQQAIAAYEDAMNEMTVRIAATLTTRQKQHLSEEIASYIDDFRKLNSKVETASIK